MFDGDLSKVSMTVPCKKCRQNSLKPLSELVSSDSVACHFCHALIDITRPYWREVIREAACFPKPLAFKGRRVSRRSSDESQGDGRGGVGDDRASTPGRGYSSRRI